MKLLTLKALYETLRQEADSRINVGTQEIDQSKFAPIGAETEPESQGQFRAAGIRGAAPAAPASDPDDVEDWMRANLAEPGAHDARARQWAAQTPSRSQTPGRPAQTFTPQQGRDFRRMTGEESPWERFKSFFGK